MGESNLKEKFIKSFLKYKYINISIILVSISICIAIIKSNNHECDLNEDLDCQIGSTDSSMSESDANVKYISRLDKTAKYKEAKEQNDDTVGWIYIPGTTIDYPVMQGVNNDYYLRKNEKKEYAFEGCIFGDDDSVFSPPEKLSNNLVIHGHNLDDNPEGKRFAQLVKFQDVDFAEKTPYIYLTTPDGQLVYEIYAVYFSDIKFGYNRTDLDEELQQIMIDEAKRRSEYIYDVDVSGKDKLITLSTCTYRFGEYGSKGQERTRFVIQGKLLGDQEKLREKIEIKKNPTPKAPDLS